MNTKCNQILILSGGYFIVSSALGMINYGVHQIYTIVFPLFLLVVSISSIFVKFGWVVDFREKYPSISLLLKILGLYTIIFFLFNILNAIGLFSDFYQIYGDLANGVIGFIFLLSFILALIFIFINKAKGILKDKK